VRIKPTTGKGMSPLKKSRIKRGYSHSGDCPRTENVAVQKGKKEDGEEKGCGDIPIRLEKVKVYLVPKRHFQIYDGKRAIN